MLCSVHVHTGTSVYVCVQFFLYFGVERVGAVRGGYACTGRWGHISSLTYNVKHL